MFGSKNKWVGKQLVSLLVLSLFLWGCERDPKPFDMNTTDFSDVPVVPTNQAFLLPIPVTDVLEINVLEVHFGSPASAEWESSYLYFYLSGADLSVQSSNDKSENKAVKKSILQKIEGRRSKQLSVAPIGFLYAHDQIKFNVSDLQKSVQNELKIDMGLGQVAYFCVLRGQDIEQALDQYCLPFNDILRTHYLTKSASSAWYTSANLEYFKRKQSEMASFKNKNSDQEFQQALDVLADPNVFYSAYNFPMRQLSVDTDQGRFHYSGFSLKISDK